ncbi:MAG TPA: SRPBCC domain-containing protein [Acidimicrobiia bacterium]|jgi:uncharacterized protein YndB with AHSA1/START domain
MTVEPIVKTRHVPVPVEKAFELFTERLDTWWPLHTHSISADEETGTLPVGVRFEGRLGGQVVEIGADGTEYVWAEVVAWDPPHRFELSWHPTMNPIAGSILEIRFSPSEQGTQLYLEHRGWEAFGERALELRGSYDPGWDQVLVALDAAFV